MQLESLDLPLTWNGFAFWKIFWITFSEQSWEQGGQGVSRLSCGKWFYTILSLILGSISEICKQDLMWSILTPNGYL